MDKEIKTISSYLSGCNKCGTKEGVAEIEKAIRETNSTAEIVSEGINQEQLDEMVKALQDLLKGY